MPRGKPFICWLGYGHDTALYVGDDVEFQPPFSDEWIKGKVGRGYIVRVGRKEYPLYMRTQIRKLSTDARENG